MAKQTTKNSVKNTKKVNKEEKTVKKTTKENTTKGKEIMKRVETTSSKESKKMLVILGSLIVVLLVFYLIAGLVTGNIKLGKEKNAEIQYSEILAGSTFKQTSEEYIVLYYDYTSSDANDYSSLISTYTTDDTHVRVYTVDLSRKFNSSYIREEDETANTNPESAKDLKLKNPTLIRIKDKKVTKYIENYEEIKNYMSADSN